MQHQRQNQGLNLLQHRTNWPIVRLAKTGGGRVKPSPGQLVALERASSGNKNLGNFGQCVNERGFVDATPTSEPVPTPSHQPQGEECEAFEGG
jgi:hypothetical protein